MVYGCGNNCVKYCVFFVNFLIFVAGAAVLGVALWANLDKSFQEHLNKLIENNKLDVNVGQYTAAIWVIAGIGGFLFLTGFLGCCGACCQNRCLLGLFFSIVLVCFLIELAAGIAAFVLKDRFRDAIKTEILDHVNQTDSAWIELEKQFNCCGVNGTTQEQSTCRAQGITSTQNCFEAIWDVIKHNAIIAGAVAIGVLVVEVLAMIFSCILCSAIANEKEYRSV